MMKRRTLNINNRDHINLHVYKKKEYIIGFFFFALDNKHYALIYSIKY